MTSVKELYKFTIKELVERFGGRWVSVHELDDFFFRNGYGHGLKMGSSMEEDSRNWAYENADVCGYIINFSRKRKDEQGQTEVYVTNKGIRLL